MRKIREILKYRYEYDHGIRTIAWLLRLSQSTVLEYLRRARTCGITWPLPEGMDDETPERMLFPKKRCSTPQRTMPDFTFLCTELAKKGVTLSLLWEEYKATHPDGYQYSQFCHWFHEKRKTLDRSFRQIHRFGEKFLTDFTGHDGCTIYPTRARKPKDKAKVENGVLLVERWILARFRHHSFFHLAELNQKVSELRDQLNSRPFQKISGNRKERFLQFEQRTLHPLPPIPYEFLPMVVATVPSDDHVRVGGHFYGVPHSLVERRVDIRVSPQTCEILFGGSRVVSNERQFDEGGMSTISTHRPHAHQAYVSWTPKALWEFVEVIGPATVSFLQAIAETRHPQELLRIGLGLEKARYPIFPRTAYKRDVSGQPIFKSLLMPVWPRS